jgi:cytochrome c biogenesis protein CcmG/thiol:disulfide interchange protein DsbE
MATAAIRMSRRLRLLPIVVLGAVLAALLWRIVSPDDRIIRSRMVGKPVPNFVLAAALPGRPGLAAADLAGSGPRLVNLFASWCVPCIAEAPVLGELKSRGVAIDAIAIRDRPEDVAEFLARHGDPYARIGADPSSRAQIALGAAGVPESFVVDGGGVIRYQHVGPIEPADIPTIVDQLEQAR